MKYRRTKINSQDFIISTNEEQVLSGKIAYEFTRKLLLGVAKQSLNFYSTKYDFIDFPFLYRERQLDSLILPCLSSLCGGIVIAEYPVRRNCNRQNEKLFDSHGRVDYWCIYKGYSLVIEVKHSYDNIHYTNDKTIQRWTYMNHSQLQSCVNDARQFSEKTNGVIRIGLQFITSWHAKGKIDINNDYRNDIKGILDRIVQDLGEKKPKSTTPNFIGCWMLNDELIDYENEYIYPGLILVAKFHDMIEHDGSKR